MLARRVTSVRLFSFNITVPPANLHIVSHSFRATLPPACARQPGQILHTTAGAMPASQGATLLKLTHTMS